MQRHSITARRPTQHVLRMIGLYSPSENVVLPRPDTKQHKNNTV